MHPIGFLKDAVKAQLGNAQIDIHLPSNGDNANSSEFRGAKVDTFSATAVTNKVRPGNADRFPLLAAASNLKGTSVGIKGKTCWSFEAVVVVQNNIE
jgi:hypothetical protein